MLFTEKPGSFKKRVARKRYPFFVYLLLIFSSIFFTSYSYASDTILNKIEKVRAIAQSGAVSLALKSIDDHQALIKDKLTTWLEWERERLLTYQNGQRWQVLQKRVADYKKEFPDSFYFWAKQQQIDALIKLKKGQQARQILQRLIWSKDASKERKIGVGKKWLPIWQKRIIKSYLVENKNRDALLAAQRFYLDYRHNEIEDRLLRGRILLINKREEEVIRLLKGDIKHPEGGMLYLLAQLRSGAKLPKKVHKAALRQMRAKWANKKLKYMLWMVVAESAQRSNNRSSTVNALEHVLAESNKVELPYDLFSLSANTLWDAYTEYAMHIGNRAQYLIGNDQQWLKGAAKAERKQPIKARSLYAMIMLNGQNDELRLKAAKSFLKLMHKRKRGAVLISQLFLKSKYFKSLITVPTPIRYDLVNIALSRSNITLASNLMATIKAAPVGVDDYQWQLRRARIFVLGGKPEKGSETLKFLLSQKEKFTREQLDQFLQVVFDLQTVKEHELAYQLFFSVVPKIKDVALQREIYYWMADSRKAQQNYTAAAQLYLRSALHDGNNGLDPWGQTARYQVAEMLAKANFLQDAHSLFEQLLRTTKEPARRAVLKHELQKLWLLRTPEQENLSQ